MREILPYAVSWMLTFLVHSTLWLGGAWMFLRLRRGASAELRDFLWRGALIASLLTPTAQIAADFAPLAGALRFTAPLTIAAAAPALPAPADHRMRLAPALPPSAALLPAQPAATLAAAAPARARPVARTDWQVRALAVWAAIAALAIGLLLFNALRLRRSLHGRSTVGGGAAARALERMLRTLGRRAPRVRLTESKHLAVPIALGIARPEICVPRRALRDLGPAQQHALIGHELAHLLRRDPAWLGAFAFAERALWFQPLLRVASRGAREAAEELCDAWSARSTGDPVALADCLVEVARWIAPGSPPFAAACMARPDSPLRQRVTRLLEEGTPPRECLSRWAPAGAASVVVSAALLLPGFSCKSAEPERPQHLHALALSSDPETEVALIRTELQMLLTELKSTRDAIGPAAPADADARLAALQERLFVLYEKAASLTPQTPQSAPDTFLK
jgi:beta-lactamase regulating signal transducer with metallopeptidase domain